MQSCPVSPAQRFGFALSTPAANMVNDSAEDGSRSTQDEAAEAKEADRIDATIPDWLTAGLFVELVKKKFGSGAEIQKFAALPAVSTGENFMTVLLRVHIGVRLADASPAQISYVVKTLHTYEIMRDLVRDCKIFDKERLTYNTYVPAFEALFRRAGQAVHFGPRLLELPVLHRAEEMLVMEDLRLQGFKNIKRQYGMDMAHTRATLAKLAQFHAASACYYEQCGAYPRMYLQCFCSEEDNSFEYRATQFQLLRECLPLYNDARYLADKLRIYCETAPDQLLLESPLSTDEFYVLNHGDLWSNNIMFRYDEQGAIAETYFIDYQLSRFGPPTQDLYYVLLSSTCLEIKLKHFDYFISYYHAKLTKNLRLLKYAKRLPTLRDLHMSLFRHGDWAYTVVTSVLPIVLLDQTNEASIDNIVAENGKGTELKRKMYRNQRYVEQMKMLLPWLDNRGLLEYPES